MHDGIVGIALKRAARKVRSHPRIERVVHEQVRQDRRDRRTLRSSPGSLLKGAIRVLQRRSQPPLDIQQHPAAVGHRFDRTNHEVPRHLVEELLDIKIDRPVELPAPLPACRERVMGRLTRPVAIGVLMKPWLHQRLQEHGGHRLRDPVRDRRHPEQTDTRAVRLGDLDRLDRRWKPGPRAHPIPDLVEVPLKVSLELLEILPIHAGGALVGLDPPPRLPRQLLGNRKRLAFRLWHISSRFLPEPTAPVDRLDIPDEPTPPQQAGASPLLRAGPPASAATGTQCLGFPPLARSLSRPLGPNDPRRRFRRSPSHVPCKSRRPGSRRFYAGHRLASNAGSRQAHPEDKSAPRFRCHLNRFRRLKRRRPTRARAPTGRFWNVFLIPT
jgi:hypothetical protein